jgi:hypothetical protein
MSVVGQFPGMRELRRRTVRAEVNPMDKSTVFSIYPKEIDEKKWTLDPGRFLVPAGSFDKPASLVVGPSSWWREIDEEQPLLEIPVSSIQIADSVVKDYCNGIFGCNMGDSMPGLFYVPGEHNVDSLKKSFPTLLKNAHTKQQNFYSTLIRWADSLWARSSGNPLTISDDMRMAARELGLSSIKDWMKDFTMLEMTRCKACGTLKNPQFPVCAACHFPDPDHPMTKQLLAARQVTPEPPKA